MRTSSRRFGLPIALLLSWATVSLAHQPGPNPDLPPGTLHELRIKSATSLTVSQQINQPAICANPTICLQDEVHLPLIINFATGVIAIDGRNPFDEQSNPVPPGGFGGILFQTQAGPAEMRFAPPCENPDGCVGGTAIYIGTIDDAGNIRFPSLGIDFELFGVSPISPFRAAMGTGSSTDPSDPGTVAQGTSLDFVTGNVVLAGIELVPAPIVGSALELNKLSGMIVPVPVPPAKDTALKKCQKAIEGSGARFIKTKQRLLRNCVDALLTCAVNQEAGAPVASDCTTKANELCTRMQTKIINAENSLAKKITNGCTPVGTGNLLATAGGLGFGLNKPQCDALSISTGTKDGIAACVVQALECAVEEILARLRPRAFEVLSANGYAEFVSPQGCVPSFTAGDATGFVAGEVLTCHRAIAKAAARFVATKQRQLQKCIDGYLSCQIGVEQSGLTGAELAVCLAAAQLKCDAAVSKIQDAETRKVNTIRKGCTKLDAVNIPALVQGLGFSNLVEHCQSLTPPISLTSLDNLIACLDASLDCSAEGLARRLKPRASEVLTGVSVGSNPLLSLYPCLAARCGDWIVDVGEQCDPLFHPGDTCTPNCTAVVCGDGLKQGSEECDDGNTTPGDGCSATCKNEPFVCGNGTLEPLEICDDSDSAGGDGCSASCLSNETCGNGVVDTIRGEQCDDGGGAYVATLDGAQETPPVATAATGTATFTLNGNDTLTYNLTTSGLSGTGAHIHTGAPGVSGAILIPLAGGPTTWSGTTAPLTPVQITLLKRSGLYVNVHTVANPNGEIRGQIGFAAPVSGDGCSADCRSNETCGNGVIDTVTGEACDDGNAVSGDGCSSSCQFESCSFFNSGSPLGTRNVSVDSSVGGLFNSIIGLGVPVGTVAYTSGSFALTASTTDANGNASLTLGGDVIVGIRIPGGLFTECLKFEATGSAGTLHCCGGYAVGMSYTRDSNTGGIPTSGSQANGPAVALAGIGTGRRGDLQMTFQVSESTAPLNSPALCQTAVYDAPSTQYWTSGTAAGQVLRALQGGTVTFTTTGQAFSCSTWTTTNAVGSIVSADTALNAIANIADAANLRVLDDQGGD